MKNYYATLEVPVGCSVAEAREAYRRLVQEHLWNRDVFAELKEAYEVLTTPARRADYDRAQFGQTFAEGVKASAEGDARPARACPMGAASQCPVINARVPLSAEFCPECGVLLSAMPAPDSFPDFAGAERTGARLEDATGQVFTLRPGANIVGREGADILLNDKTVSRRHAQIVLDGDGSGATLQDLGSTNGTRIAGGDPLPPDAPFPVTGGARVQFGSVELILRLPLSETSAPPDAGARLVSVRGTDVKLHALAAGVTTFGRRSENSVVLAGDPYISGHHAQVIADGDTFRISDLGSTNGTRVNGAALTPNTPRILLEGDEVILGGGVYRFERAPAPDATATPENVVQDSVIKDTAEQDNAT